MRRTTRGLDEAIQDLRETADALKALEAGGIPISSSTFDPNDPTSIEAAIATAEQEVDKRLNSRVSNTLLEGLVSQFKDRLRQKILDIAAEARTQEPNDQD